MTGIKDAMEFLMQKAEQTRISLIGETRTLRVSQINGQLVTQRVMDPPPVLSQVESFCQYVESVKPSPLAYIIVNHGVGMFYDPAEPERIYRDKVTVGEELVERETYIHPMRGQKAAGLAISMGATCYKAIIDLLKGAKDDGYCEMSPNDIRDLLLYDMHDFVLDDQRLPYTLASMSKFQSDAVNRQQDRGRESLGAEILKEIPKDKLPERRQRGQFYPWSDPTLSAHRFELDLLIDPDQDRGCWRVLVDRGSFVRMRNKMAAVLVKEIGARTAVRTLIGDPIFPWVQGFEINAGAMKDTIAGVMPQTRSCAAFGMKMMPHENMNLTD